MPSYYSRIHVIGLKSESEFWGDESPSKLFLFQGEGNRQWVEAHFPSVDHKNKCEKKILVPEKPFDLNTVIDACMVFLPDIFREVPDYEFLKTTVSSKDFVDLNLDKPLKWDSLRKECMKYMGRLDIRTFDIEERSSQTE